MRQRRCIHDEYGNIDPVKAAETPVPRGSTSKKRRISDEHDGEAINKRIKRESFAGLVSGEVSQWNRYPLAKPRAASATEQRDMIATLTPDGVARASPIGSIPIDSQLSRDEEAIIDDAVDRMTIVSTIEHAPGDPMEGVIEASIDSPLVATEPQTPGPPHRDLYEQPNGVSHSPGPSPLNDTRAASAYTNASRSRKATVTPHKVKSRTPKSTPRKKGRRDSKETVKLESDARAMSSTENEADMASYALAMKLQQQEYGLRRRSK